MAENAKAIVDITSGKRYNVSGVLCDLKQSKYAEDTKNIISFNIEDNTAKLRCVGFDEAHKQLFNILNDGTSYTLKNIIVNKKDDGTLEAKIFKDTKIDIIEDIQLTHNLIDTQEKLMQMENQRVQIHLYVHEVDTQFTLKNSNTTCTKITAFHHLQNQPIIVVLTGNAANTQIETQNTYIFQGKATQMKWIFTNKTPIHTQNTQQNIHTCNTYATNHCKVTDVQHVQDIQKLQTGQIVKFTATVKAAEIQTSITKKGKKRTITLIDKSHTPIQYTIFGKKAEEYTCNVGNTVHIQAVVAKFEGNTCLHDTTFRES